jgi:hypothetical protein
VKQQVKHVMPPGTRYGRWTVVDSTDRRSVLCRCDCGIERRMPAYYLFISRGSRSCGCLLRDVTSQRRRSHGATVTGRKRDYRYNLWANLMGKCYRPTHHDYRYYGGRGIRVHEPWHDAASFMGDLDRLLGPRPDGATLDRIDNDGDYEPRNVRWATRQQQSRNRRPGIYGLPKSRLPGERGCSLEGCESKHYGKGLCRRHYRAARWEDGIR